MVVEVGARGGTPRGAVDKIFSHGKEMLGGVVLCEKVREVEVAWAPLYAEFFKSDAVADPV